VLAWVYYFFSPLFLPALILIFSVLATRLAGKSFSDMTYLLSSATLNLHSVNQSCIHTLDWVLRGFLSLVLSSLNILYVIFTSITITSQQSWFC